MVPFFEVQFKDIISSIKFFPAMARNRLQDKIGKMKLIRDPTLPLPTTTQSRNSVTRQMGIDQERVYKLGKFNEPSDWVPIFRDILVSNLLQTSNRWFSNCTDAIRTWCDSITVNIDPPPTATVQELALLTRDRYVVYFGIILALCQPKKIRSQVPIPPTAFDLQNYFQFRTADRSVSTWFTNFILTWLCLTQPTSLSSHIRPNNESNWNSNRRNKSNITPDTYKFLNMMQDPQNNNRLRFVESFDSRRVTFVGEVMMAPPSCVLDLNCPLKSYIAKCIGCPEDVCDFICNHRFKISN
jgi:hypothetical protein